MSTESLLYPVFKYDPLLEPGCKEKIIVPSVPKKPVEPTKPTRANSILETVGVFIITPSAVVGVAGLFQGHLSTFIICGIIVAVLWIVLSGVASKNDKRMEDYHSLYRDYSQAKRDYYQQLGEVQRIKRINESITDLVAFNERERGRLINSATHPFEYTSKRGYSEIKFEEALSSCIAKYFKDDLEIILNAAVSNFYEESDYKATTTSNKQRPYQPDFCIKDKGSGIYFDIEIDEPYSLETRTPLHYIITKGKDDKTAIETERDAHFLYYHNWAVIRFSEEQVIKHTTDCIHYILRCIYKLNKNHLFFEKIENIQEFGNDEDDLEFVMRVYRRWDKEQALQMEKEAYRENYLNLEAVTKIKDEDNDLPF